MNSLANIAKYTFGTLTLIGMVAFIFGFMVLFG